MSSIITFPFIHKPYSIDKKTSTYAIPAGYYARATGSFNPGQGGTSTTYTLPSLTVDGDSVLYCNRFSITNGSTVIAGSAAFTIPTNFTGYCMAYSSSTTAAAIQYNNGTSDVYSSIAGSATIQVSGVQLFVHEGHTIQNGTGGNLGAGNYTFNFIGTSPEQIELWVPTGTSLSGTSGTFIWEVELYPDLT
jgi:hypothetical protein